MHQSNAVLEEIEHDKKLAAFKVLVLAYSVCQASEPNMKAEIKITSIEHDVITNSDNDSGDIRKYSQLLSTYSVGVSVS